VLLFNNISGSGMKTSRVNENENEPRAISEWRSLFDDVFSTGTSQGVPTIGFDYPPEFWRTQRTIARDPPSMSLQNRPNCRRYPRNSPAGVTRKYPLLDAVVFTHAHADHIMGLMIADAFATCEEASPCLYTRVRKPGPPRVFAYAFHVDHGCEFSYLTLAL
jgi:hypothetical protein